MKKLAFCMLATLFMLSVTPIQLKASSESIPATPSSVKSSETAANTDRLNEIKSIGLTTLNASENKEILKENNLLKDDQLLRSRRDRNSTSDVGLKIGDDRQVLGDGNNQGIRTHNGTYIGLAGILIIILILVLVL